MRSLSKRTIRPLQTAAADGCWADLGEPGGATTWLRQQAAVEVAQTKIPQADAFIQSANTRTQLVAQSQDNAKCSSARRLLERPE